MKANTLNQRLNMFVTSVLDGLLQPEKPSTKLRSGSGRGAPNDGSNRAQRRDFFYYMLVIDDDTKEIVGHLADISTGGFRLDTRGPVPVNRDFRLLMHLPSEVSEKPFMAFGARSRWCRVDPIDPFTYNVGYQLIHFAPEDLEVFIRMMQKYGRDYEKRNIDLRRSKKW